MKKSLCFLVAFITLSLGSCSDSDEIAQEKANAVAFVNPAQNLVDSNTTVSVVFAAPTQFSGSITLSVVEENALYGTDYTTSPAMVENVLVLPFQANVSSVSFDIQKLINAFEGQTKNMKFTISSVVPATILAAVATNSVQLNFNQTAVENNSMEPAVGGPTVPKQVFVDFSSGQQTAVNRDSWELAFYAGDTFSVSINGAIKMAVKKTNSSDITAVVEADNLVAVGEGGGSGIIAGNPDYVDNPNGSVLETAIANISEIDADNKVYLVNMGHTIATEVPNVGSINPYGSLRGWKKIRVLRSGGDYKLQYANIDSSSFSEVLISKKPAYNYSFFSLVNNNEVTVEPLRESWDLNFTPFTNLINFGSGLVSYAYQDFVVTNSKVGTRVYQVLNSEGVDYANFSISNLIASKFETEDAKDQRVIGASWRNGGGPTSLPSAKDDRFYILKDSAGNIYKVRFLTLTNAQGERGHSSFEYVLLK